MDELKVAESMYNSFSVLNLSFTLEHPSLPLRTVSLFLSTDQIKLSPWASLHGNGRSI